MNGGNMACQLVAGFVGLARMKFVVMRLWPWAKKIGEWSAGVIDKNMALVQIRPTVIIRPKLDGVLMDSI